MRKTCLAAALVATLATATAADAQAWGPPLPPPPYGYAPPPPPPPPPAPPPYVTGRAYWSGYGYARPGHRCWTEYRHGGWERVRVCR